LAPNRGWPCAAPSFISAVPALPQRRSFTWLITAGMTMTTAATIGGVGANARATKCARGSATTRRNGAAATTSGTIVIRTVATGPGATGATRATSARAPRAVGAAAATWADTGDRAPDRIGARAAAPVTGPTTR